ncbi:MAG: ROK family protein [Erysipelotrichaceae bacterium]|nr:ROK family protein [Erysipelotrichaceae bacterium]MDY6035716.1 ROK family protein [Bulleidia sp.]
MKTYIGIDLGGTNVRVAKVSEFGEVLAQVKGPSYGTEGPAKVMSNLKDMVRDIPGWKDCSGIGVGVPGPVEKKSGSMVISTNLKGFTGYPFADELSREFGMPAFIDNDANVAGLAEALVGAGKDKSIVYYVTISTGIGGALIVDGKTVAGKHGFGGEIANIIIDRNRQKINDLNIGAVENEASGTHITRKAKEKIHDHEILHAGSVFELAADGNPEAIQIVDEACKDLGQMFATIACVCDPDIFIIGGGMMKSADKFLPKVIENYKAMSHTTIQDTPFVIASLDEPGIIGAAMLPMSEGL